MTPLQESMLIKIATSEFTSVNGAIPESVDETVTWASTIIENNQDKGVFTSLLKEGLVTHTPDGVDSLVALTSEGLTAYHQIK